MDGNLDVAIFDNETSLLFPFTFTRVLLKYQEVYIFDLKFRASLGIQGHSRFDTYREGHSGDSPGR